MALVVRYKCDLLSMINQASMRLRVQILSTQWPNMEVQATSADLLSLAPVMVLITTAMTPKAYGSEVRKIK